MNVSATSAGVLEAGKMLYWQVLQKVKYKMFPVTTTIINGLMESCYY